MAFGYSLLRGKNGASGHVRKDAGGRRLEGKGLNPGEKWTLYALGDGKAVRCRAGEADREGRVLAETKEAGTLFLAAGDRPVLWEPGDRAEETYLACAAALRKLQKRARAAETPEEPRKAPPEVPVETAEAPLAAAPSGENEEAVAEEAYALRPASSTPPVDALPAFQWPPGTEDAREAFETRPPIRLFAAPGWRFVRLPSPAPGTAYWALGRYAPEGRVTRLAYAVPGAPQRPPARLPGFRYREGFWVKEVTV